MSHCFSFPFLFSTDNIIPFPNFIEDYSCWGHVRKWKGMYYHHHPSWSSIVHLSLLVILQRKTHITPFFLYSIIHVSLLPYVILKRLGLRDHEIRSARHGWFTLVYGHFSNSPDTLHPPPSSSSKSAPQCRAPVLIPTRNISVPWRVHQSARKAGKMKTEPPIIIIFFLDFRHHLALYMQPAEQY